MERRISGMATDDRLRYGRCWWCGEPDSLFRLEGARLAGSRPLPIPSSVSSDDFRVCPKCAIAFGYARQRHDAELAEAAIDPDSGIGIGFSSLGNRRVWDRIKRSIEDEDAEGE